MTIRTFFYDQFEKDKYVYNLIAGSKLANGGLARHLVTKVSQSFFTCMLLANYSLQC